MRLVLAVLVIALLVGTTVGQSTRRDTSSPQAIMVGRWRGTVDEVTFRNDGTVSQRHIQSDNMWNARWQVVSSDSATGFLTILLRIDFGGDRGSIDAKWRFTADYRTAFDGDLRQYAWNPV